MPAHATRIKASLSYPQNVGKATNQKVHGRSVGALNFEKSPGMVSKPSGALFLPSTHAICDRSTQALHDFRNEINGIAPGESIAYPIAYGVSGPLAHPPIHEDQLGHFASTQGKKYSYILDRSEETLNSRNAWMPRVPNDPICNPAYGSPTHPWLPRFSLASSARVCYDLPMSSIIQERRPR